MRLAFLFGLAIVITAFGLTRIDSANAGGNDVTICHLNSASDLVLNSAGDRLWGFGRLVNVNAKAAQAHGEHGDGLELFVANTPLDVGDYILRPDDGWGGLQAEADAAGLRIHKNANCAVLVAFP